MSPGEALAALPFSLLLAVLIALFFFYPQVLTAAQFLLLLRRPDRSLERQERVFDALTLSLGLSLIHISSRPSPWCWALPCSSSAIISTWRS